MRPPTRRLLFPALLASATLFASACGEDFDPASRLNSLRVLAIRSEPPVPGPGAATTLSALVYTPMPDPSITFEWSWCPFPGSANDGYPCGVTEAELAAITAQTGMQIPSFNLGTEAAAKLTNALPPEVLGALCRGVPGAPEVMLDCQGGFPVQIKLKVKTATDEVIAVRSLRLPTDQTLEPNSNPRIEGLAAVIKDVEVPITEQPTVTLPRLEDTVIKALVSESNSEPYTGKNDDNQPAMVHETLTLSWFVETGDLKYPITKFLPDADPKVPLEVNTRNKWNPARASEYPAGTSRLFVVLRDSRGGVNWEVGAVNLEPTP